MKKLFYNFFLDTVDKPRYDTTLF
ncbi:MAG TPA: palindromic element RPE4 domain-containing protein [Rickettsia endosymbiont of Ceroptres masudai]|nr:palindromic element RPE4 domain-containing protein [Rickettsia endosymbiont of Ceroptres masudai]